MDFINIRVMSYIQLIEDEIKSYRRLNVDTKIEKESYIIGAGDSYAAALVIEGKTKRKAIALDPYEALEIPLDREIIIVSVSGKTKYNIEVAKRAKKEDKKVISITANKDSPLAKESDEIILLPYSSRTPLPGTLSFLLTLSALYSMFNLEEDTEDTEGIILNDNPFFVGKEENYGIAYFASLKMNEIFGSPANYERLELFVHSPIFSTRGRQIVILSSGDERERTLSRLVNFTDVYITECKGAFCNAFFIVKSVINTMKKRNWDRIYFVEDKQILNISSTMIY